MLLPFFVKATGAGSAAERDQCPVFPFAAICEDIETRLGLFGQKVQAVQKTVEEFGHGLGRLRPEHENAPVEALVMIQLRIPDTVNECQVFRDRSGRDRPEQAFGYPFQGHISLGAGLEMGMLGNRSTAVGTVIENNVIIQLGSQVQHIREAMPDGLRCMDIARNDQMVGKNGSPVHQNIVFASLASLKRKGMLVLHVVFLTKRATVVEDGQPARIGLQRNQDAADGKRTRAGAFESPVLGCHCRPHRQLVVYEFVDICCHNLVKLRLFGGKSYRRESNLSLMRRNSDWKLGVRMSLSQADSNSSMVHHFPSDTSPLSGSRLGWPTMA